MDISAGTLLTERYRVVSKLGSGSMGAVYLAEDLKSEGKQIALKILHSHVSSEIKIIERFKQEIRLAKLLSHPNIVRYYELGELPSRQYYLSMEYFEGRSLADTFNDNPGKGLAFDRVLSILYYLSCALQHMHINNIIHRDIKPGNILVGKDGQVKITDLGIARSLVDESNLTGFDQMIGTPAYMAPERFVKGHKISHLVDIYAFGILAYWLVCGKVPFEGENSLVYMWQHLLQPMPGLNDQGFSVPAWFQKFVEKCAAKNPEARFQSMAEVAFLLHKEAVKLKLDVPSPAVLLVNLDRPSSFSIQRLFSKAKFQLKKTITESNQNWKNLPIAILIALSSLFLFVQLPTYKWSGILEKKVEHRLVDMYFNIRGQIPAPKDVIIVAITDKSFEQSKTSYMQPFDREQYVQLLEKLKLSQAKKVIIDLRFLEGLYPAVDLRVAKAFELTPTFIGRFRSKQLRKAINGEAEVDWLMPSDPFASHAAGIFDGTLKREDGVVRRFMPTYRNNAPFVSFANIVYGPSLEDQDIPTPRDFINYYGKTGSINSISLHDVLHRQDLPVDLFKDKFVLVGIQLSLFNHYQSDQQPDSFFTSFGSNTYGVEIHATNIANLLDRSWIRSFPMNFQTAMTVFLSTIISLLILQHENQKARLIATFVIVASLSFAYVLFINGIYFAVACFIYTAIISLVVPRAKSIYERATLLFLPKNRGKILADSLDSEITLN